MEARQCRIGSPPGGVAAWVLYMMMILWPLSLYFVINEKSASWVKFSLGIIVTVSHLPYDFVTSVSQSSLRRFVGLQLFLTAEFVRWRHLHCSMICHHLLWCGQAPLPISVNENGGAYVSVPKADVYAI